VASYLVASVSSIILSANTVIEFELRPIVGEGCSWLQRGRREHQPPRDSQLETLGWLGKVGAGMSLEGRLRGVGDECKHNGVIPDSVELITCVNSSNRLCSCEVPLFGLNVF
jgi:hypothetical protein